MLALYRYLYYICVCVCVYVCEAHMCYATVILYTFLARIHTIAPHDLLKITSDYVHASCEEFRLLILD